MKILTLLALSLIIHMNLKAQDKPEINFWSTKTTPATLKLPPLRPANIQQANSNSSASTQSFDTTALRLHIVSIRRGNLVINHALQQLVLIGSPEAFNNLSHEQITILAEYYPNITLLGFEGLPESDRLIAAKISSAFKHVKKFFIMPDPREQLPEELIKLIGLIVRFNSK